MKGNNCQRSYPDGVWLPNDESQGTKYHAVKCGAHRLEWVEDDGEIAERIYEDELSPCSHCMEHHDLEPIFIIPPDLTVPHEGMMVGDPDPWPEPMSFHDLEDLYPRVSDAITEAGERVIEETAESFEDYPEVRNRAFAVAKSMESNESDLIELSHSYTDTYEGDRAKVTETVYIEPRRAETVIGKLVFKLTHHSEKGRWEALKEDATRVEIERTVYRNE